MNSSSKIQYGFCLASPYLRLSCYFISIYYKTIWCMNLFFELTVQENQQYSIT